MMMDRRSGAERVNARIPDCVCPPRHYGDSGDRFRCPLEPIGSKWRNVPTTLRTPHRCQWSASPLKLVAPHSVSLLPRWVRTSPHRHRTSDAARPGLASRRGNQRCVVRKLVCDSVLAGSGWPAPGYARPFLAAPRAGVAGAGGWRNSPAPGSCCTTTSFMKVEPSEPTAHNASTTRSEFVLRWAPTRECSPGRDHRRGTAPRRRDTAARPPRLGHLVCRGRMAPVGPRLAGPDRTRSERDVGLNRASRSPCRSGGGRRERGAAASLEPAVSSGPSLPHRRSNSSITERSVGPPRRCSYLPVSFPGACRRLRPRRRDEERQRPANFHPRALTLNRRPHSGRDHVSAD